jgi:hypothetical protein
VEVVQLLFLLIPTFTVFIFIIERSSPISPSQNLVSLLMSLHFCLSLLYEAATNILISLDSIPTHLWLDLPAN